MQPEKEIEKALVNLKIEAKETRRRTARNILIAILLAVVFFVIPYEYPQFSLLYGLELLIILFGSLYIFLSGVPTLIQPLREEYHAFQRIAHAIEVLEKSKDPVAYREALRDMKKAYSVLKSIELKTDIKWYEGINEILTKFLENLQLIVLTATKDSVIKKEHLEEIALAIYSLDPTKIEKISKDLENEPTYKKSTVTPASHQVYSLMRSHTSLKHGMVVSSFVVVCGILYYMTVTYLGIQKEYVFGASVALFIGLIGIYFRGRQKSIIQAL